MITYDEHGGFFDHVEPPAAEDEDPRPEFHALGPRVPALVISPRVRADVSHDVFDHTSIIKTCLVRFCRREGGLIPDMGARVGAANHLGAVLEPEGAVERPDDATLQELASKLADWRADSLRAEVRVQDRAIAPDPDALTDFQEDYVDARQAVINSLSPEERARAATAVGMTEPSPRR